MTSVRHALSLLHVGLKSAASRPGASSIVVLGIASAVAVFILLSAVSAGLESAIIAAGHADRALILRRGAASEMESGIAPRVAEIVIAQPEVAHGADGTPAFSEEIVRSLEIRSGEAGLVHSFPIRGLGANLRDTRPEIRIVRGRVFNPGTYELMLGRAVVEAVGTLDVGASLTLKGASWKIVGVFDAAGSSFESEIFADARTLQSFYQAPHLSAVTVRLHDAAAFASFKATLEASPDVAVQVERESEYYDALSSRSSAPLRVTMLLVGGLMGVAALFLALNAIHSAFTSRTVEIATLRALGFEGRVVATSVLLEVGALAVLGAALGALVGWALCMNTAVSLLTGDARLTQTAFRLQLTSQDLALAIVCALIIGFLGALPSAIRAARQPVVEGLRAAG